jgi:hypothetical protein
VPTRAPAWARSTRAQSAFAFSIYAAVTIAYFGLPVLPHLGRDCVCVPGDGDVQMWFLVWWKNALLHAHHPFLTDTLFAPDHVNLGALTLAPGGAVVAVPFTLLFGPVVSYNLLALASPTLAAFFAFLLCRYVSRSFTAGLIGGYVFGFSSYMLGHMLGHLTLVLTFPVPAAVLLTLKLIDGRISPRRFVPLMALTLGALFLFSSEVTFTFVLLGAVTLALALVLAPESRARVAIAVRLIVAAGAVALLVTAPFVYFAITGDVTMGFFANASDTYVADVTGFLVPTRITRLGRAWFDPVASTFSGNIAEDGVYVGVPFALIVARYAVTRWGAAATRVMIVTLSVVVLLMLGRRLHIAGYPTVPLPWKLLDRLPLLDQVLPVRLGLYASLILAVILALWVARPRRPSIRATKWGVVALAVVTLAPNLGPGLWRTRENTARFFAAGGYKSVLRPGETVLALPWGINGSSMLWHAEAQMSFRLAGGYVGALLPPDYRREPILPAFSNPKVAPQPADLQAFLGRHDVSAVVVDAARPQMWPGALEALGLHRAALGGVLYYRVPGSFDPS